MMYSLCSVSFGSGEGLVVGDMCSGELAAAAAAATAAAAARLRWRREAGWDPRFLLVIKFNAYLPPAADSGSAS